MKKLAVITTHPIQYNAPLFKMLAASGQLTVKVFYTWGQAGQSVYDRGFGSERTWDIPLLDGYDYEFLENQSSNPGSHHYNGINNPGIIKKITAFKPDAILVFGWSFKSHLKVLRHFKGKIKLLFRGDSTLLDEKPGISLKKIFRFVFLKWVYSHIDIALYVGVANKHYYKKFGLKENQLIFAPHAVDNDRFANAPTVNMREALKIPTTAVVFLYAGKLELKKNLLMLVKSFAALNDQSVHLVIAGSGAEESSLKNFVAQLQLPLQKNIHFLPFQNQQAMPALYKMSDIFVLPSQGPGETWGLSVNEAMACSKAVMVSDKCGCAIDLVAVGDNGYIFKHNSQQDLTDKINLMISTKTLLHQMGKHSFSLIQQRSLQKVTNAILTAINQQHSS